jgi:hypothetical protein
MRPKFQFPIPASMRQGAGRIALTRLAGGIVNETQHSITPFLFINIMESKV